MFPTLQKNQSPFSILPTFIKCLGVKIDNAEVQQDFSMLPFYICHLHPYSNQVNVWQTLLLYLRAGKIGADEHPTGKRVSWINLLQTSSLGCNIQHRYKIYII